MTVFRNHDPPLWHCNYINMALQMKVSARNSNAERGAICLCECKCVCVCVYMFINTSHLHGVWKSLVSPSKRNVGNGAGASVSFPAEEEEGKKTQVLPVVVNGNNELRAELKQNSSDP